MKKFIKWIIFGFILLIAVNLILSLISSSLSMVMSLGVFVVVALLMYKLYKSNLFQNVLNKFKSKAKT